MELGFDPGHWDNRVHMYPYYSSLPPQFFFPPSPPWVSFSGIFLHPLHTQIIHWSQLEPDFPWRTPFPWSYIDHSQIIIQHSTYFYTHIFKRLFFFETHATSMNHTLTPLITVIYRLPPEALTNIHQSFWNQDYNMCHLIHSLL